MVNSEHAFTPDYAVPPGETLKEAMEHDGMTIGQLALRTGVARITLGGIISGKVPISRDMAARLEKAIGIPVNFWLNAEANYQERIRRMNAETFETAVINWNTDMAEPEDLYGE